EVFEIVLASICSIVTWHYTAQHESRSRYDASKSSEQRVIAEGKRDDVFLHPSAGLMLASCIIIGCCVSSFVHRRQDKDQLQPLVIFVLLASAVALGSASRESANMVLLGYIPPATCVAMVVSILAHSFYRRWRPSIGKGFEDEKGR
ncbi:hypothetical protein B0T17DRAFT_459099, partial [Bombardia bombarda]